MPCSKGMGACYAQCAHRRFVLDYVAERDAQLDRAETPDELGHFRFDDFFENVEQRLTFKAFLRSHAGADYPYPRIGRPAPIDYQTATSPGNVESAWPATSSSATYI
jgi:hypothetical protein